MAFSYRTLKVLSATFFTTSLLLAAGLVGFWLFVSRLTLTAEPPELPAPPPRSAAAAVSPLLVQYKLDVPGRGEIFPAMAAGTAKEYWPLAVLNVTNTAEQPVVHTITAEVPGWTRRSEETLVIAPRETRTVRFNPELLPWAFENEEVRQAKLEVRAVTPDGATAFSESRPVLLHGASDLYWGKRFANAQYVTRWVTPHDAAVLKLVADARRFVRRGRLPGYNIASGDAKARAAQVRMQAQAVFRALQRSGLSYVSSIFVMGEHIGQAQRIRLPNETLRLKSANCMDVSVAFAAAMENLGMHPVIVIVPGHAFTGVRLGPQSQDILYLDLTVLPDGSFTRAISRAEAWRKKTPAGQTITVDVAAARALGLYPLPT